MHIDLAKAAAFAQASDACRSAQEENITMHKHLDISLAP